MSVRCNFPSLPHSDTGRWGREGEREREGMKKRIEEKQEQKEKQKEGDAIKVRTVQV